MERRILLFIAASLMLCGCREGGPPAAAYRNWGDRLAVAMGLRDIGLVWPCMKKDPRFRDMYGRVPLDQCYRMDPPQRWTGLWRNAFEGSRFCPAPATDCRFDTPGPRIWLDSERASKKEPDEALYSVEFVGRRTSVKGHYGHMGVSDYEVVADRFLSMKQIGGPALLRM